MSQKSERSQRRAPGEGSLHYDESRRVWWASLDVGRGPNGQRQRTKRSAATKSEAAKILRRMRQEHENQRDLGSAHMTVAQLVSKWLAEVAPLSQSAKTHQINEGLSRCHVVPAMGALKVTEVTPEHVETAIREWIDKGLSRSTILKCRNILTAAFRHAESRRIISWNPAKLANLPPATATPEPKERTVLNAQQFAALIKAAEGSRLQLLVTLLGTYGFRPGELQGLRWENVDLTNEIINVRESLHSGPDGMKLGRPKTRRSHRPVQISPADVQALSAHRLHQAAERNLHGSWPSEWTGLVFTTASGQPLDSHNLRREVRRLGRRIGVDGLGPYDLRSTATSIAADHGVPIEDLADLLGHVDTAMVMRHYRKRLRKAHNAGLAVAELRQAGGQA